MIEDATLSYKQNTLRQIADGTTRDTVETASKKAVIAAENEAFNHIHEATDITVQLAVDLRVAD